VPRLPAVAVRGADATDPGAGGVRAADVVVVVTAAQMLDLAIRAIIAFGVPLSVWLSFRNHQKIREVHLTMNSRLDQLLNATKALAYATGAADANALTKMDAAAVMAKAADAAANVLHQAGPAP